MSRKIGSKWFRRSWAEPTQSEAEATARSGLCSGKIAKVVKEYLVNPKTGEKKVMWSVFTRPKHFSTEAASREWGKATADMSDYERQDKARGLIYHILAR